MQTLVRVPAKDNSDRGGDGGVAYANPITWRRCPVKVAALKDGPPPVVRFVALAKVFSPQRIVWQRHLIEHITRARRMVKPLPVAHEHDGAFYILDGNHRVCAMCLKGRMKMRMRVAIVGRSRTR